jgi:cytochrome b
MARAAEPAEPGPPDLWDPVVRLSHGGLAAVVLANGVLTEGESLVHVWIGWAGLAMLVLRLVWGFVGPVEARFASFPPDPGAALRHIGALAAGRTPRYRSHNPAGALMVYALWMTLAVLVGTGIAMTGTGPLGALERERAVEAPEWSMTEPEEDGDRDSEEREEGVLGEVHELAANLILVLALLHVAGVAVESRLSGRDLLRPMLTGASRRRP